MESASWLCRALRGCIVRVLRAFDALPRHVGIVMDGNRRYARLHGHASAKPGHTSGFEAMSRVLDIAYAVGIEEVTLYAFSIENFHRTPAEVADLMDIARERLSQLIEHGDIADKYGVRINIIGRLNLLPEDVQLLAHRIMAATQNNTRATLNMCMPYTARDDIARSLATLASENVQDASEDTIRQHLSTRGMRPLDLLIRTSDTSRLSDFLLWETTSLTFVDFVPKLWPEYSPWSFLCSLMRWRVAGPGSSRSRQVEVMPEPKEGS